MITVKNWKGWTAIVLIFLTGFVGGFMASRHHVSKRIHHYKKMMVKPGFEGHLYEQLNASEELIKNLDPILKDFILQWKEGWHDHSNKREALVQQLNNTTLPYLNSEQKEKFQQIIKRMTSRYHHDGSEKEGDKHHKKHQKGANESDLD